MCVIETTFVINDSKFSVKLQTFRRLSAIFDLKLDQVSQIELHLENCSINYQMQLYVVTVNCHEIY